jgi:hypothetical protein
MQQQWIQQWLQQQQQQQQQQQHGAAEVPPGPPPAATSSLAALPTVAVTEKDLADEANSTCCVCIDDFVLGEKATRLPCGHLFHRCVGRSVGRSVGQPVK